MPPSESELQSFVQFLVVTLDDTDLVNGLAVSEFWFEQGTDILWREVPYYATVEPAPAVEKKKISRSVQSPQMSHESFTMTSNQWDFPIDEDLDRLQLYAPKIHYITSPFAGRRGNSVIRDYEWILEVWQLRKTGLDHTTCRSKYQFPA
jgi:hypothetical protein